MSSNAEWPLSPWLGEGTPLAGSWIAMHFPPLICCTPQQQHGALLVARWSVGPPNLSIAELCSRKKSTISLVPSISKVLPWCSYRAVRSSKVRLLLFAHGFQNQAQSRLRLHQLSHSRNRQGAPRLFASDVAMPHEGWDSTDILYRYPFRSWEAYDQSCAMRYFWSHSAFRIVVANLVSMMLCAFELYRLDDESMVQNDWI